MRELRGAPAAAALLENTAKDIACLSSRGIVPCLGVVRIGQNPSDISYEKGIIKRFEGMNARVQITLLDEKCTEDEAERAIQALNADKAVHGILLFLPVPKHLNAFALRSLIDPQKDVDGANPLSAGLLATGRDCFAPCTAAAVTELISYYNIPISGRDVCVVGRSAVVGRPLATLLINLNATVTVCHTKTTDLARHTRAADIIVACAGSPAMLKEDMVNEESCVIDVGTSLMEGKIVGDVSIAAREKAAACSPVPGGVGALTTTLLLKHTVESAKRG